MPLYIHPLPVSHKDLDLNSSLYLKAISYFLLEIKPVFKNSI